MTYVPIESKISLINKYIQLNIIRNKGAAMHVDVPENEIFNIIIADLKELNEKLVEPEETKVSLTPIIDSLKIYEEKQVEMRFQVNALMKTLQTLRDEQTDQANLDAIIKNLEELEQE